jgi:hypothetical protein
MATEEAKPIYARRSQIAEFFRPILVQILATKARHAD